MEELELDRAAVVDGRVPTPDVVEAVDVEGDRDRAAELRLEADLIVVDLLRREGLEVGPDLSPCGILARRRLRDEATGAVRYRDPVVLLTPPMRLRLSTTYVRRSWVLVRSLAKCFAISWRRLG